MLSVVQRDLKITEVDGRSLPTAKVDGHLSVLLVSVSKQTNRPEEEPHRRRAVWCLAKKYASSGSTAAPQIVNKVLSDHDSVGWVISPSIQSTENAPVMPSSASPTVPYAWPPTMLLVSKPVRTPIVSNNQEASIKTVSFCARGRWNRALTPENRREHAVRMDAFADIRCSVQPLKG